MEEKQIIGRTTVLTGNDQRAKSSGHTRCSFMNWKSLRSNSEGSLVPWFWEARQESPRGSNIRRGQRVLPIRGGLTRSSAEVFGPGHEHKRTGRQDARSMDKTPKITQSTPCMNNRLAVTLSSQGRSRLAWGPNWELEHCAPPHCCPNRTPSRQAVAPSAPVMAISSPTTSLWSYRNGNALCFEKTRGYNADAETTIPPGGKWSTD